MTDEVVRVATRGTFASTTGSFGIELAYDPGRPFEVRMLLCTHQPVWWMFARSLLMEGLRYPTGCGDVSIAPYGESVGILLSNGIEAETVYLPRHVVEVFVAATIRAVPPGAESMDVRDEDLYAWLEEAS